MSAAADAFSFTGPRRFVGRYDDCKKAGNVILNDTKCTLYFVEGNIGAGKTEALKLISSRNKEQVMYEPVAIWRQKFVDGETNKNILQLYYDDMKRWGFNLQIIASITRLTQVLEFVEEHKRGGNIFVERSIWTDWEVFSQLLIEDGVLDTIQIATLQALQANFRYALSQHNIMFVYVQTPPDVCYERIKKRASPEEKEIPLAYIERVHRAHEATFNGSNLPGKVVIVSGLGAVDDVASSIIEQSLGVKKYEDVPLN